MKQNKMRRWLLTIKPIPHVWPISVTSWQAMFLKLDKRLFSFTLFAIFKKKKERIVKFVCKKEILEPGKELEQLETENILINQSNLLRKRISNRSNDCDVTTFQALWRQLAWPEHALSTIGAYIESNERQLCTLLTICPWFFPTKKNISLIRDINNIIYLIIYLIIYVSGLMHVKD